MAPQSRSVFQAHHQKDLNGVLEKLEKHPRRSLYPMWNRYVEAVEDYSVYWKTP